MVEDWYQITNQTTGVYKLLTIVEMEALFKTLYSNYNELLQQALSLQMGEVRYFSTGTGEGFIVKRMEVN